MVRRKLEIFGNNRFREQIFSVMLRYMSEVTYGYIGTRVNDTVQNPKVDFLKYNSPKLIS